MLARMWVVETRDEAGTRALGRALGAALRGPLVVALDGDLGAGKTCFAQGAAAGLGVADEVVSPTFVLLAEYEGRLPLLHGDAYRLRPGEAEDIGLEELVEGWPGLVLIEWADRVAELLPDDRLRVELRIPDAAGAPERRRVEARATGPRAEAALAAWRAAWEAGGG